MKIAFFDCFSGISGDMILGALLDLGLPGDLLLHELKRLPLPDFDLEISTAQRMNLQGKKITIKLPAAAEKGRTFREIKEIIKDSSLNSAVKETSIAVFQQLATAEAKIHRQKIEAVHFHEVGAIDSLVDIVGAGIGLHFLKISQVHTSSLPMGSGFTKCRHGIIPLPAPAVVELLRGVPVHSAGIEDELVTPTGAAILKVITTEFGPIPPMEIERVGYGVGTKIFKDRPNLLRIILGEAEEKITTDRAIVIETNIDDMNPQIHGYLMERLLEMGAFDVSFQPLQMKKNRPGVLLRIICEEGKKSALIKKIFQETTTLGIRCYEVERFKLPRWSEELPTRYGSIPVKVAKGIDGNWELFPEYEGCKQIAKERGIALKEVYRAVQDQSSSFKPSRLFD